MPGTHALVVSRQPAQLPPVHAPAALQVALGTVVQSRHAMPPLPHWVGLRVPASRQLPFLVQVEQVVSLQTPFVAQVLGAVQVVQVAPLMPQVVLPFVWQLPVASQQPAQVAAQLAMPPPVPPVPPPVEPPVPPPVEPPVPPPVLPPEHLKVDLSHELPEVLVQSEHALPAVPQVVLFELVPVTHLPTL